MNEEEQGWVASRFARLSTGIKMLLILSLGLFPLGLIAILASLESARENMLAREGAARAQLEMSAQSIDAAIARSVTTIRAASAAIALSDPGSNVCSATLMRLTRAQSAAGRFTLYDSSNRLRCASPGYRPPPIPANPEGRNSLLAISADGAILRFALFDDDGHIEGVGEFSRETLAEIAGAAAMLQDFDLALSQGARVMPLRDTYQDGPLVRSVTRSTPVLGGRLQLSILAGAVPVSAIEVLMILLPVMMWLFAAIIGWLLVNWLLLRPLREMQRAVAAYEPGDSGLDLPALATPALEIGALGRAFDQVTRTVARHEAELEAGIERQKKLVREVHHRVKNNLQVVASLLNIHARGATNEEVAAAYASIQRRVDALAVVHRNHYAELEENRGVAMRPLVSELCANLRATAPSSASAMTIKLGVEPYYVTQDVAVSVAFLITEIVEFAMFCGAASVTITLAENTADTARLTVETESLREGQVCDEDQFARFDRIVTGLSRQLRSSLDRDPKRGRLALSVAVADKSER